MHIMYFIAATHFDPIWSSSVRYCNIHKSTA